ncbi:NTP transferase domain-containing protein [Vulcanisaeta thermophila]|uniref:NTP transferase domain-containing protein n=1 Tax=Vulcanisaeta thermophila TaxID=867917 RepID=UPI0008531B35|nr:NTP transferase domain-containing protein [Vulcanisaeta thermophila]
MNVLIMAGGRGTRLGNPNKPLINVCGRPMIEAVVDSVRGLGRVYVVTTKSHTEIINWALGNGVDYVITRGLGYAEDLLEALGILGAPSLVLPGDMPLITREFVIKFLRACAYLRMPMVTLMNVRNGVSEYTGISYVRSVEFIDGLIPWVTLVTSEPTRLINVNTREDLEIVRGLCGGYS